MSYIGQGLPADSFQGFTTDSFTGDGSATTFTLSKKPFDESALLVVINNVVQKPTTNFTVSGTTLTIVGTAVASGDVIYATHIGGALPIGQAVSVDLNGASDQLILDADADTTISADTDDQIDVKVGGTDRVSFTSTGINLTQDGDSLKFGANSEVVLTHVHDQGLKMSHDGGGDPDLILANTASASDGNQLGTIFYNGQNSNGDEHTYAFILGQARDVTDGEEDGQLIFYGNKGGSDKQFINYGANANGASPTHEVCINEGSEDIDFRVESNGKTNMLFVDGGNDRVNIGASTGMAATLVVADSDSGIDSVSANANTLVIEKNDNCGMTIVSANNGYASLHFGDPDDADIGQLRYDHTADLMGFHVNASERMRLTDATLMIGCTTATPGVSNTTDGLAINTNGRLFSNAAANSFSQFATDSDGNILSFASAGAGEGTISISGSTITYGAFTGTHWSRLADNSKPTILRGTLMESLDEMCDWYQAVADIAEVKYTAEDEEVKSGSKNVGDVKEPAYKKRVPITLPNGKAVGDAVTFTFQGETHTGVYEKETDIKHVKCKISNTADSKKIYGLFSHWDPGFDHLDDDVNDMSIAQVGTFIIRVNKDVTVEAGDLLVSNGDGTAKVLEGSTPITADVQSSIVAKVNSNIKVETYSDGSYTVPCTLHC